jgi:hypothetical protein
MKNIHASGSAKHLASVFLQKLPLRFCLQWGVESLRACPIQFVSEKPPDFLPPTVSALSNLALVHTLRFCFLYDRLTLLCRLRYSNRWVCRPLLAPCSANTFTLFCCDVICSRPLCPETSAIYFKCSILSLFIFLLTIIFVTLCAPSYLRFDRCSSLPIS